MFVASNSPRQHPSLVCPILLLGILGSPAWTEDSLTPVGVDRVTVGGEIGRRIDVTVRGNLLALDMDHDFLLPFEQRDRSGGYIGLGKLIDAAVRLAAYTGDDEVVAQKNHLIDTAIGLQGPDGYLGIVAEQNRMAGLWDVHEMGYIVYGLCSDYESFGRAQSLKAARRLADYILANWPKIPDDWGQHTGVATHVAVTGLERAMLRLGRLSGEQKYIEFCRNQRALDKWDLGIVTGRQPLIEGHIYAYLTRCLAQLELYRIVPDDRLLTQTARAIDFLTAGNGMAITGGAGQWEIWTDDQDGRGALAETCATAYQVRLLDSLLRLTAEPRYGDLMERTIFNTLFAAQSPDGRQIRYYTPLEGPRKYHPGDTYCCPCNYRRIIAELPSMICYRDNDGLTVNLYTDSTVKLELADGLEVSVCQKTDYPNSGRVEVGVEPSAEAEFGVRLRIPAWCPTAQVTVNDGPVEQALGGQFFEIHRTWAPDDRISLELAMPWRLVKGRERQSGRVAVMRGPLVFCLNPTQNEALAPLDGADLGQITLDPLSLRDPVPDDSVRPGGLACEVGAWKPGYSCSRPGNLKLRLTEFADPDGRAVYFRLQDFGPAVDDELLGQDDY